MIKHTCTTVGKKSIEAIVAEFRATLPPPKPGVPDGEGWVEVTDLRKRLGMGKTKFSQTAKAKVGSGEWQREIGTKMGRTGIMRSTMYYRVTPKVAQTRQNAPQRAKGGA